MNSAEKVKQYLTQIKPGFMGKFFYYCAPFRRHIVLQNIKLVFGYGLDHKEQVKLAQCFYAHMTRLMEELIAQGFLSQDQIRSRVEIRGKEHMLKALAHNKGVLVLGGHLGNWEISVIGISLNLYSQGFPKKFYCIRKSISNKFIEKIMFNRLFKANVGVIYKHKALGRVIKALANGDVILMAFDQHSSVGKEGILVNFFNKAAGTYHSLSKLAKKTAAPVVPLSCFRLSSGKHVVEFHPEMPLQTHSDPEEELRINTQAYNNFIEEAIVAHPEQWIWMHRRWRKEYVEELR